MKTTALIILVMVLSASLLCAQSFTVDSSDQTCKIDTVVNCDLNKEQLYSNALNYIAKSFKNSNNVIQSKDLELGEIIVKGSIITECYEIIATKKSKGYRYDTLLTPLRVHFNANIYTRDNKFKVDISSIKYDERSLGLKMPVYCESKADVYEDFASRQVIHELIIDFAKGLNIKPLNEF